MHTSPSPLALVVNGQPFSFSGGTSLAQLVAQLTQVGQRFAVELNGQIIPRSHHASTPLHQNDQIEIVTAVGGG